MLLRIAFLFASATLLACGTRSVALDASPEAPSLHLRQNGPAHFVDWMHAPLRARDGEAVRFSVSASADAGVRDVELYVYEYELYRDRSGAPSQRRRPHGLWGRVAQWPQAGARGILKVDYEYAVGFKPHTRVEYVWRVTDVHGEMTDRIGLTDAGTSPWPQDKVLLYAASQAPMRDLIDIAFFRDSDYGARVDLFRADVEAMVIEGFLAESAFGADREHWAFYTTDRQADGRALSADVTNEALIPGFLKDFSIPGIDAFCLVHREDYTDRSLMLENFHSLSNNLFSAEAHNWGTAVHEVGHAIFHLSDEYDGCACFQSHAGSNVFRERADCAAWNLSQGFPTSDCYEVHDLYERLWWSAEEPTFFADAEACRAYNERIGLNPDSCRVFIDERGVERFWAFESTCIMHDDGDDEVRPFQRACRRNIDDFYARLRRRSEADFAGVDRRNVYGYEPVVGVAMRRKGFAWSLEVESVALGVPSRSDQAAGEVSVRVMDGEGRALSSYRLANAGAVHRHSDEGAFQVPARGVVRLAIPADAAIERVACEYDRDAHAHTPDHMASRYSAGYVFEVGDTIRDGLRLAGYPSDSE